MIGRKLFVWEGYIRKWILPFCCFPEPGILGLIGLAGLALAKAKTRFKVALDMPNWLLIFAKGTLARHSSMAASFSSFLKGFLLTHGGLPVQYLRNLVDSMPRRLQEVIALEGGLTKY